MPLSGMLQQMEAETADAAGRFGDAADGKLCACHGAAKGLDVKSVML